MPPALFRKLVPAPSSPGVLTHSSFVRLQTLAPGSHLLISWPDQALITLPHGSGGQTKGHTNFFLPVSEKTTPWGPLESQKGFGKADSKQALCLAISFDLPALPHSGRASSPVKEWMLALMVGLWDKV